MQLQMLRRSMCNGGPIFKVVAECLNGVMNLFLSISMTHIIISCRNVAFKFWKSLIWLCNVGSRAQKWLWMTFKGSVGPSGLTLIPAVQSSWEIILSGLFLVVWPNTWAPQRLMGSSKTRGLLKNSWAPQKLMGSSALLEFENLKSPWVKRGAHEFFWQP